jgi:hypothetical protein
VLGGEADRRGPPTFDTGQRRRVGRRPSTAGIDGEPSDRPDRHHQHHRQHDDDERERYRLATVVAPPALDPTAAFDRFYDDHEPSFVSKAVGAVARTIVGPGPRPGGGQSSVSSLDRIGATDATV